MYYEATVTYGTTDVTLMATARDSGSTQEASGTTAQGRPLGTQTTVNGLQKRIGRITARNGMVAKHG